MVRKIGIADGIPFIGIGITITTFESPSHSGNAPLLSTPSTVTEQITTISRTASITKVAWP